MSRNVTILVIILVILLIAGYLMWIRQRFQAPQGLSIITPTPEIIVPSPIPTIASPSATATPSGKPSAKPTTSQRTSTASGRTVR